MKKAVAALSGISAALVVFATGCTTVIKDATATPPKVETYSQDTINARVPDKSFFGSATEEDSTFQDDWMFFCSGKPYPDTNSLDGVSPYAKGIKASGSMPIDADLVEYGINIYVPKSKTAANEFAEKAISDMKGCSDADQSSGGSGSSKYTVKGTNDQQSYSHAQWQGYSIHTESIYTMDSGKDVDATIVSVVANRSNVVVLLNFYAGTPTTNDKAIEQTVDAVDQFLDKLDSKSN